MSPYQAVSIRLRRCASDRGAPTFAHDQKNTAYTVAQKEEWNHA